MSHSLRDWLNTNQVGAALGVKGGTIRRGMCINGHYLGLRPVELPNRRLLWEAAPVRRLRGEVDDCPRPTVQAGGAR
jgi:hypothetical protein